MYLSFEVWLVQIIWLLCLGHGVACGLNMVASVDTEGSVFSYCVGQWDDCSISFYCLYGDTPLPAHSHNSKAWHKLSVMQTTTKHSHALQQTVTQDASSYCVQKWCPRATQQCSLVDLKIHSLPVMFISPLVSVMILSGHFAVYRLDGEFYPYTHTCYAGRDLKRPTPT